MLILSALALTLAQGDPPSPPLEARIGAYVRQLREEGTRDRAVDRLVHLGRGALPHLERLKVASGVLDSIRRQISENEALGASYRSPHLFSFDGSEEPLGALLERLETGAGVTFHKNSLDLSQPIALDLPEATFWEAFDAICKKASIWYYPGEQFYLNGGTASPQPRAYYGPFMIVMERVIQQRKINFDQTRSEYTIRLVCVWERTVSPLGPTGRFTLTEATDDTGASLLRGEAPAPAPRPVVPVRMSDQHVDLTGLVPPAPGARKLAVVRGSFEVEFPARLDEVRFPVESDAPSVTRPIEGAQVELRSFSAGTKWGSTAEFQIRFQDRKEAEGFRIASSDVEIVLPGNGPLTSWINSAQRDPEKGTCSFSVLWRVAGRVDPPREIRLKLRRGSLIKNVPFCYRDVEIK